MAHPLHPLPPSSPLQGILHQVLVQTPDPVPGVLVYKVLQTGVQVELGVNLHLGVLGRAENRQGGCSFKHRGVSGRAAQVVLLRDRRLFRTSPLTWCCPPLWMLLPAAHPGCCFPQPTLDVASPTHQVEELLREGQLGAQLLAALGEP